MDVADQLSNLNLNIQLEKENKTNLSYGEFFRIKFREIDDEDPELSIYQKIRKVNSLWQKKQT